MPQPFGSFPFDAAGIDLFAHPILLGPNLRAPTVNDVQNPGTQWLDVSVTPPVIWETVGAGVWERGGVPAASTTVAGVVTLTDNNEPVATKNYVDTIVAGIIVGAIPLAQQTVFGIVKLATDAIAVAGTANNPGVTANVIQPSNLKAIFEAPPTIGNITPSTGAFTTLGFTTATGTAGGSWASGGTAIQIGQDASNDNISIGTAGTRAITLGNSTATTNISLNTGTGSSLNLGTNAIAHTVTIGNVTTTTAVNVNTGTGGMLVTTTSTGNFAVNSGNNAVIDAAGVVELNSSGGVINIGDDAINQAINFGTGGTRTITIGSTNATLIESVGAGGWIVDGITSSTYQIGPSTTTGAITIGGTAQTTGVITLGSSSATSTVKIQSGAGASTTTIGEGTLGANTTSINNGATGANSTVNILSGAATAGTHTVNIFTGNASGGTQTFNLFTGTNAGAVNIGTGTTGVKTITIGGTAANVITIANTQTAGSFAVGNAMTSGTITLGGANGTGAITIGQATNATGQTVLINSGASIAGPNVVSILAGATPAANQTFNLMTGVGTAGTYSVNILTGNSTGTTQTVSIGTGSARTDVTIGGTGANVIAIGNTQTTGSFSVGDAMTSGTITLGGTAGTGLIAIGKATNITGQTVAINNGASNTGPNIVNILNGATPAANTTLNIMNGAGSAGTQTVNILATGATRAGVVNIGTGAAAHSITLGQVTSTIAVNGPQTNTLASGAATALTVTTAAGTGIAISSTSSAVTVPDLLSNVGGIKVTPTSVVAGASPQTCNNRHGQVIFNTVSIAAGADQAFVISNSTITGASTIVMYSWFGTTTGSAVSLKSVVNAAGQSTLTFTNGAGATTTTSNITVNFWVLN